MHDSKLDDFFADFNAIVWKTYDTLSALDAFESFWKETERLVASAADVSEKNETFELGSGDPATDYRERRRIGRHLHDEIVTPTFRYAAVITLFAVVERELKRFAETLAKEEKHTLGYRDLKGGLLEQLSRYTEVYRGFRLNDLKGYIGVRDLQKVRNCLVHAYGDPAMMSSHDKAHLLKMNSDAAGIEAFDGMPLGIGQPFIAASLVAAKMLFLDLFAKVGWTVNDRWLAQPPAPAAPA
ncbi:MAG: hypothetical protein NTV51_25520 [Verrucomicrobia bacterium]|nr:hypothetical protein [Verrucomicrobiota bacterium]